MSQVIATGRLTGKVAVVTGGASGIGRAIALAYANEGARVVIATARNEEGLIETQAMAPEGSIARFMADASIGTDIEALVAFTEEKFGRLDVMCNNAGVLACSPVEEMSEQEWDRVIDVNLKGTFLGCKYSIPAIRRAGGGSIINVGSVNSVVASAGYGHYCAAKGGVLMLTKAVALECAAKGIRANVICPGIIDTPMNAPFEEEMGGRKQFEDACLALQPLGLGTPAQVAAVAVFLAADESSLVTGTEILVDGGFTAQ
jgi:dihydroanticapsin dehydrogenase